MAALPSARHVETADTTAASAPPRLVPELSTGQKQTVSEVADSPQVADKSLERERSRSVQFASPSPRSGMSTPSPGSKQPGGSAGAREAYSESSADETTAIVQRQRRSSSKKGYGTAGAVDDSISRADESSSAGRRDQEAPLAAAASSSSSTRKDKKPVKKKSQQDAEEKLGLWKGVLEKFGSFELDNKGSVARDHLALERTFLAWLRTSLAFASIGIAITQLFRLNTSIAGSPPNEPPRGFAHLRQVGKPLGATFLGIAIVVLFIGFHRYFESQFWIMRGKFPASRGSIGLVSAIAGSLIVASLVVVLVIEPSQVEKR